MLIIRVGIKETKSQQQGPIRLENITVIATGFITTLVLGLRSWSWVVVVYCKSWKVSDLYVMVHLLVPEYPSCLQTTLASNDDHRSSQTVPHMLKRQISTRPWYGRLPPTSLTLPWLQGAAGGILHHVKARRGEADPERESRYVQT